MTVAVLGANGVYARHLIPRLRADGHRALAAARKALAPIERRMLLSPEQGAQTTVHCATAPVLESGYYRACELAPASGETHDRDVSRRLWDETEQWATGLMGGY